MEEICKRCKYSAFCLPLEHEHFFYTMALHAHRMHSGLERLMVFFESLPRDCPGHPNRKQALFLIAKAEREDRDLAW